MLKRMGVIIGIVVILIVVLMLLKIIAYPLDYRETAVVRTFGKASEPIHGSTDAGLKFRAPWPIQRVQIYPATILTLDSVSKEVATHDKRQLILATFCNWRIVNPAEFHRVKVTVDAMEDELRTQLAGAMDTVIGRHDLTDMVNTDPKRMIQPKIEAELLQTLRRNLQVSPAVVAAGTAPAADAAASQQNYYGIEVISVGIKMLALPEKTTTPVIEAMKSQQEAEAKRHISVGEEQAETIRTNALASRDKIMAFAGRRAGIIESKGWQAAAELYPKFQENEEFAIFLRSLRSLERELEGRTVFVLDGSRLPGMPFFREGPFLKTPSGGNAPAPLKEKN